MVRITLGLFLILGLCGWGSFPMQSDSVTTTTSSTGTCDTDGSDDFSTNTLATNWSQLAGTWTYDSTNYRVYTGTTASELTYTNATPNTTSGRWAKVKIVTLGDRAGISILVGTTGVHNEWRIQYEPSGLYWGVFEDGNSWTTNIASSTAVTFASGDVMAVSLYKTATLSDTVIRVWKNPTGATPCTWGTPDVTFTTDPSTDVTTTNVGLANNGESSAVYDDFSFGDWSNITY